MPIAVNQSRIFFYDTEYLNKLEEIVRFYAVDPSLIILEVTETVAMNGRLRERLLFSQYAAGTACRRD